MVARGCEMVRMRELQCGSMVTAKACIATGGDCDDLGASEDKRYALSCRAASNLRPVLVVVLLLPRTTESECEPARLAVRRCDLVNNIQRQQCETSTTYQCYHSFPAHLLLCFHLTCLTLIRTTTPIRAIVLLYFVSSFAPPFAHLTSPRCHVSLRSPSCCSLRSAAHRP